MSKAKLRPIPTIDPEDSRRRIDGLYIRRPDRTIPANPTMVQRCEEILALFAFEGPMAIFLHKRHDSCIKFPYDMDKTMRMKISAQISNWKKILSYNSSKPFQYLYLLKIQIQIQIQIQKHPSPHTPIELQLRTRTPHISIRGILFTFLAQKRWRKSSSAC
ncbi:hypothetical protein EAF00_003861 [Botryotinia globosa]|nr:hypothetical protein EAF00_003861 [Botryotinia globosa]